MTDKETLTMLRARKQTRTYLTDAQKKQIIETLTNPTCTVSAVANAYNVSRQTIYNILAEYEEEAKNEDEE